MKVRSVSNVNFLKRLGFLVLKESTLKSSDKWHLLTAAGTLVLYRSLVGSYNEREFKGPPPSLPD